MLHRLEQLTTFNSSDLPLMPIFVLLPKYEFFSIYPYFKKSLYSFLNYIYFAFHVIVRRQVRWTSISDCSVRLASCCHQQSPVQSWLEKEWEECVWRWESIADSSTHPFNGPRRIWRQQERSRRKQSVIIGAAGAMCPVLRAGKWRCESETAGRRCPQLLLAYEVPPDHLRPPSVNWRWARQPGNHLLLRWWLPASAALPERTKSQFSPF